MKMSIICCYECDKEIKTMEDFNICKQIDCNTEICNECSEECYNCERKFCSEHCNYYCDECEKEIEKDE